MKAIGSMVDYISAHHYSVDWGPFERNNYLQHLYVPEYIDRLNRLTVAAIQTGVNDAARHCKVAWDEWNLFGWVVDGVNDDASYTLGNAIITALILNLFIRNSDTIGMANYSTFVNINGAVSAHGDRLVRRAQFAAFDLLSNNLGDEVLDVRLDAPEIEVPVARAEKLGRPPLGNNLDNPAAAPETSTRVPLLDCTATRGRDGAIYLSLINKSPDADLDTVIRLPGLALGDRTVVMKQIYHDSLDAANTLDAPDTVAIRDAEAPGVCGDELRLRVKKHSINMIVLR